MADDDYTDPGCACEGTNKLKDAFSAGTKVANAKKQQALLEVPFASMPVRYSDLVSVHRLPRPVG